MPSTMKANGMLALLLLSSCGSLFLAEALPNGDNEWDNERLYAWDTGYFGGCCNRDAVTMMHRTVQCKQIWTGAIVGDDQCTYMPKPCQSRPCACGVMECSGDPETCHGSAGASEVTCTGNEYDESPFMKLGCISDDLPAISDDQDPFDYTCQSCSGNQACHGGLPYYRKKLDDPRPGTCVEFCVSKGLDLAGLVGGTGECRCGGSSVNTAIYSNNPEARECLAFQSPNLNFPGFPDPEGGRFWLCPVAVYRFAGFFEDHGIPWEMLSSYAQDTSYVDSIAVGRFISEAPEIEMEGEFLNLEALEPGFLANSGPGYDRTCYPNNCGPGAGPWKGRKDTPPQGVSDVWQDYVIVRYAFESNVDNTRKAAFRVAAERWHTQTCIVMVEEGTASDPFSTDVKVGIYDTGSCYVAGMGNLKKYGDQYVSKLNLGWCNTMSHIGSMVHEIGHVLGMNHEQKRPDAQEEYYGHGPYLQMLWQNIGSDWISQWTPDATSYVGSADDGASDAFSGYAEYDFDSIMHYPISNEATTIPSGKQTGNRHSLSPGDIEQMLDVYQCIPKGGTPATPTLAPATPAPTPGSNCQDLDGPIHNVGYNVFDPWGDGCDVFVENSQWCGKYDDSDFSVYDMCCGCGGGSTGSAPAPTPPPTKTPTAPPPTAPPTSAGTPAPGVCSSTESGATDPYGDSCDAYTLATKSWCGGYDDGDFSSATMCCACGGGSTDGTPDTPAPTTPPPTEAPTSQGSCPWLQPNPVDDQLGCADGTKCNGWTCCNDKGGRAQCPQNYPTMCLQASCGGGSQHCCSQDTDCAGSGGPLPCDTNSPPPTSEPTEPPTDATLNCPWLTTTTALDTLECVDGTVCHGWACCVDHGGRAKCPPNMPNMCNQATCGGTGLSWPAGGTQHCCAPDCSSAGGNRACQQSDGGGNSTGDSGDNGGGNTDGSDGSGCGQNNGLLSNCEQASTTTTSTTFTTSTTSTPCTEPWFANCSTDLGENDTLVSATDLPQAPLRAFFPAFIFMCFLVLV